MKYKLSQLAIGLAAVAAFSGQAFASNTNFLTIIAPSQFVIGNAVGVGAFTDNYAFTIGSSGLSAASVTESELLPYFDINSLHVSLYRSTALYNTAGGLVANGIDKVINGNSASSIGVVGIAAGMYDLQVTGLGSGSLGGGYGGHLTVAPVPEPAESALMLSGIAMLGFIASRRSKKAA